MSPQHERRDDSMNAEEVKMAMKSALKEWLDEKFAEFGRWTLRGVLAAILVALTYFILRQNGWQRVVAH